MSTSRGMGPSLNLLLREQHSEADGREILRDGNCAEVGFTAWTQLAVTPTKETVGAPAGFTYWAKLVANAGVPRIAQNSMILNRTFRIRCLLLGDGVNPPRVTAGAVTQTGIAAATWQSFDFNAVGTADPFVYFGGVNAAGYVGCAMMSVQEVLTVTWDSSEYCDTVAYLASNRGGAQECLSIVKLEHVDRHTGAISTVADFSNSPGAGAVYTLPTGWTYSCATAGRTTQTSLSTIVTGIAANQAPAKSVTGAAGSFGVGLESQRTNDKINSGAWLAGIGGWGAGTMTPVGTTVGPDGGGASAQRFTSNAAAQYSAYGTLLSTANSVISFWGLLNSSGGSATCIFRSDTSTIVTSAPSTAVWTRYGDFKAAAQATTAYCSQSGVGTLDLSCYGLQSEVGKYPTSYIPTAAATVTRSAATLTCPQDECNTHSGRIPRITIRPHFAYNESLLDASIIDDSRGHLFFEQSTQKFVFEVRGKGRIASLACTFSRDQEIVLRADIDEATNLMTLVVSGATTGNGTFQTYAAPKPIFVNGNGYTAGSFYSQLVPRGVTAAVTVGKYLTGLTKSPIAGLNGYVFLSLNAHPDTYANGTSFVQVGAGTTWMTGGFILYNDPVNHRFMLYWGAAASAVTTPNNSANTGVQTVCGVADNGTLYLYINGRLAGTAGPFTTSVYRTDLHVLGDPPITYNGVRGDLYGFRMGVLPITAQQVSILHAQAMRDLST